MEFNLADQRGLDARVVASGVKPRRSYYYVDPDNKPAQSRKVMRRTVEHDLAALMERYHADIDGLTDALIEIDPEVDYERVGAFLENTSRIFVNTEGEVAHAIQRVEVVYTPEGEERERRPARRLDPNVAGETPLRWTGRRVPKAEAVRRFVFSRTLQLSHVNGLTYDFLYRMASDLAEQDDLLLLGAGPRGTEPLVLRSAGKPYRAFLEGRVQGPAYMLLLHLSNIELKAPTMEAQEDG